MSPLLGNFHTSEQRLYKGSDHRFQGRWSVSLSVCQLLQPCFRQSRRSAFDNCTGEIVETTKCLADRGKAHIGRRSDVTDRRRVKPKARNKLFGGVEQPFPRSRRRGQLIEPGILHKISILRCAS